MTGLVHATGNFPELLWPGIKNIFGATYNEWPELYSQFFALETSNKAFEKEQQITGLPKAVVKGEGDDITYEQMFQGYQKEYYHVTYALGGAITREMYEDDLYSYIKKIPQYLARSLRETEEVIAHRVLNNGFSDTGPDGVSLFNTAHPLTGTGGTLQNRPTTAADLTQTSLEQAVIDISNWTDDQGNKMLCMPKKLVVPTAYTFQARKILETQYAVGSANNDKNILATMPIEPVISPYLTDGDAWFLTTDCAEGLKFFTRRPAEIERDNEFDTQNLKIAVTKRFSTGFTDWRGVYGSPGA